MTAPASSRIVRFSLTSADPASLSVFYRDALGFVPLGTERVDAGRYGAAGQASVHRLGLGAQEIELVGFERPGRPYPVHRTSQDSWFQHLALVARDIDAAYARLCGAAGWQPISRGDRPVVLPASSGGVSAVKFRDPEGHPLELLAFPADRAPPPWSGPARTDGPLVGIDHSAIVVADVRASLAFYAGHGFAASGGSENAGPGQDALDGADGVTVSVRALSRPAAPPHLELLGYQTPRVRRGCDAERPAPQDVACTRTVLSGSGMPSHDPDGHASLFDATPG